MRAHADVDNWVQLGSGPYAESVDDGGGEENEVGSETVVAEEHPDAVNEFVGDDWCDCGANNQLGHQDASINLFETVFVLHEAPNYTGAAVDKPS